MILGQNPSDKRLTIAFQGFPGSFSHMTLVKLYGDSADLLPCNNFQEAFNAVASGEADRAVIPDLNIIKGRPSEVPNLIRQHTFRGAKPRLHITDEYSQQIDLYALMHKDADFSDAKVVISHPVALEQMKDWISRNDLEAIAVEDTAGAAKFIADTKDLEIRRTYVAASPPLAAEIYPLQIIERNIEDIQGNSTHFYSFSRKANKVASLERQETRETKIVSLFMLEANGRSFDDYDIQSSFRSQGVSYSPLMDFFGGNNFSKTHMMFETSGHMKRRQTKKALRGMVSDGVISGYTTVGMHMTQSNKIFGRQNYK